MQPQYNNFNAGLWLNMETFVQKVASALATTDTMWVCKGGTIKEGQRNPIGKGYFETQSKKGNTVKVAIPRYYFMAILAETKSGTYQSIGFLVEQHGNYAANYPAMSQMKQHVISIDELESFTDIDFFCNLNDKLENQVEKGCNVDAWSWN